MNKYKDFTEYILIMLLVCFVVADVIMIFTLINVRRLQYQHIEERNDIEGQ